MGDRLDLLFQEWHNLGGAVLLDKVDAAVSARSPEEVLAESTAYCRASGRLTWIVLDWLIRHIEQLDEQKLRRAMPRGGDRSVLGVLCDAAYQRNPHPKLARLMAACAKPAEVAPFFHRVARSPLALRLTRDNALEVFKRWNYLCSELRFLDEKEVIHDESISHHSHTT